VGPSPGTFTRPGPGSPHHGAPQARSRPSGLGLLLRVRARDHRGPGAGTGCGLDPGTGAGIGAHPDQEHAHGAGWQAGRVALCSPAGVVRAGGAGRSGERAPGAPPTTVLPLPPAGVWNLVRLYIPSRYSDSGIVAPLGIVSSVFGAHPSDSGSERPLWVRIRARKNSGWRIGSGLGFGFGFGGRGKTPCHPLTLHSLALIALFFFRTGLGIAGREA
jgi:hypothetical protein